MKKLLSLLIFIALSVPVWGVTYVVDNLRYEPITMPSGTTPGTVKCTGLYSSLSTGTALTIPYMIKYDNKDFYVTSIGESAFENQGKITGVRLTYGIKEIAYAAFRNCTGITYVRLPSSMTSIYGQAFAGCTALTTVYYARTSGKLSAFAQNAFPTSTKCKLYVPWEANYDDFRAEGIWNKDAFYSIAHSSYAWDIYMSDGTMAVVTTPSTSTSVDHECTIIGFNKNGGASGVANGIFRPSSYHTKPNGQDRYFKYTKVSKLAFTDNADLTQLDLSNVTTIKTYGELMCDNASNLTSVTLKGGRMDDKCFNSCSKLTTVNIDGVDRFGYKTFFNCTSLKRITLPAAADFVARDFVDGCTALEEILVAAGNTRYESFDRALYTKGKKELMVVPQAYPYLIYTTPAQCEVIDGYAFTGVKKLEHVKFTYGCKKIYMAFQNCPALKLVEIPGSVTEFPSYMLFSNCPALTDLSVNITIDNIPNITKSSFLVNSGNPNLYVRRGLATTFKNKGWTDFKNYNPDGATSADEYVGLIGYTIKSHLTPTIDGRTFSGGSCVVVRGRMASSVSGATSIPDCITIGGLDYAIEEIDSEAFKTSKSFYVTGCGYVSTVGDNAFMGQPITSITLPRVTTINSGAFNGCTSLTSVSWGDELKKIKYNAFNFCPIANDIILPVGFRELEDEVFYGAKSKTILVPSSTLKISKFAFSGMSSLQQIILNTSILNNQAVSLYNVPTTCIIRTTVEDCDAIKKNTYFKNYTVTAGAFDFCKGGPSSMSSNMYKMTVTGISGITYNGVKYDGTAKYVYNKENTRATSFSPQLSETDEMTTTAAKGKKYLITEIGDSCLFNSNVEMVSLTDCKNLERIGRYAFTGSKVRSITVPESCIKFGKNAFYGATSLSDLTILGRSTRSWEGIFVGNNASDLHIFVDFRDLLSYANSNLNTWYFKPNSIEKVLSHLAPYILATNKTQNLGQSMPLDFEASGVKAYIVRAIYGADGNLITQELKKAPANTGVIVTGLTPGNLYKIKRATSAPTVSGNALVSTHGGSVDIYSVANGYYWDRANNKFVRPTSKYASGVGYSYLKFTGTTTKGEYYIDLFPSSGGKKGDLDGNSEVDITDANILINIILNMDKASNYGGRADVDGNGEVDITDVNLLLNMILGLK